MIYFNRGINSLKIIGYVLICVFMFALASDSEEEADTVAEGTGFLGNIAIVVEQVNIIHVSRRRKRMYEQ